MEILSISFVILIIKLSIVFMPIVFGFILIFIPAEKLKNFRQKLSMLILGSPNLINAIFFIKCIRVIGVILFLIGLFLSWVLFFIIGLGIK